MGVASSLYKCTVFHHRYEPVEHRFVYPYLAFYLDLDQLKALENKLLFFSVNKFNLFSFYDRDHVSKPLTTVRNRIEAYLKSKGIKEEAIKIYLLTQLRFLGYVFNPVSFYFCFTSDGRPLCVVPEVGNTFQEMKLFYIGIDKFEENSFNQFHTKNFYVSPFINLNDSFEFRIEIPDERINIVINDHKGDSNHLSKESIPFLRTSLVGEKRVLSNFELIRCALAYPFHSLRVISAIHWQAFRLYLKRVPFLRKAANPHLQTEVYSAKR